MDLRLGEWFGFWFFRVFFFFFWLRQETEDVGVRFQVLEWRGRIPLSTCFLFGLFLCLKKRGEGRKGLRGVFGAFLLLGKRREQTDKFLVSRREFFVLLRQSSLSLTFLIWLVWTSGAVAMCWVCFIGSLFNTFLLVCLFTHFNTIVLYVTYSQMLKFYLPMVSKHNIFDGSLMLSGFEQLLLFLGSVYLHILSLWITFANGQWYTFWAKL